MDHYQGLVKVVYKDYRSRIILGFPMSPSMLTALLPKAPRLIGLMWILFTTMGMRSAEQAPTQQIISDLDNIADTFGTKSSVNEAQLTMCMKKQDGSLVNQSLKLGAALGVNATPQIFVDGVRLPSGAQPIEKLWPAIDRALKAKGIQPSPQQSP